MANFVGETKIILSNKKDSKAVNVTVKPRYNLYPDPNCNFGSATKSEIMQKYGTPYSSTSEAILYQNYSNAAPLIMYIFDENNKLNFVEVLVKISYYANLLDFLDERYKFAVANVDDLMIAYMNSLELKDATMLVVAGVYNSSYVMVMYAPYSYSPTKSIKQNIEALQQHIKHIPNLQE